MANNEYLGQSTDLVLGQEFLTWLWYKSSVGETFNDKNNAPYFVSMEQRIVVQGGEGELSETAIVSGLSSELKEARMGLTTGKKVTRALIRIEKDAEEWKLVIKAEDFSFNSLKTPKLEKMGRTEDEQEAFYLEKFFLIESCLEMVDNVYAKFLNVRLDDDAWKEEVINIKQWLNNA